MVEEKPKKVKKEAGDPHFERSYTKDLDDFCDNAVKEIKGLEIIKVKTKNKHNPLERALRYKGKTIAMVPPRAKMLFGVYLFNANKTKEIIHVLNNNDMTNVLNKIKSTCTDIDSKVNKDKTKASKPNKVKDGLEGVLEKFEKLKLMSGMKVPSPYNPKSTDFIKEIEKRGGKFDWENRVMFKGD